MYQKDILGVGEARIACEAVIDAVTKQDKGPIAVAVVDDLGELIFFIRMDRSRPVSGYMAINKAYTSARRRINTSALIQMQQNGVELVNFGDQRLTLVQGGVYIQKSDGTPLGAIGVAGLPGELEDEEYALIGVKALNL